MRKPETANVAADDKDGDDAVPDRYSHRTVDRVTRILEQVVYNPGMSLADLARVVDAPKSSLFGFVKGLVSRGWLYEANNRFYLGPAAYGLTLVSGHIRAGAVTQADINLLHQQTGLTVLLGMPCGDHLVWVAEAGIDRISQFDAHSDIRRSLLTTAGGKAVLAARTEAERSAYLRRHSSEDAAHVYNFLQELDEIRRTGIARNVRLAGARSALATVLRDQKGGVVASVSMVGRTEDVQPRLAELQRTLLNHVDAWQQRSASSRDLY